MKLSSLAARVGGRGADAWAVHYEARARARAGEDIILLSIGQEMDETTPAPIVDAAVDSLRRGRHHYTPTEGEIELRAAIAEQHARRTGVPTEPDQCVIFAGAQNALFSVAMCLAEAGDEAVVLEPYYTTYPATFTAAGARLVTVPVDADDGFQPDPDRVLAALGEATRVVVLNSPNNPTGAAYTRDRLAPIVAACAERGIWVVSDEVYADLVAPGVHESPCALPGGESVCVTVSSVSKSHRMTGWRMGWSVSPKPLAGALRHLCLCMSYGLPPFIQDAATTALRSGDDVSRSIRESLDAKRQRLEEGLANLPGARVSPTAGGMFVLLDIRALEVDTVAFARGLLAAQGVSILPCDGFGDAGRGLLRISACDSEERLAEAARRIAAHVVHTHASCTG